MPPEHVRAGAFLQVGGSGLHQASDSSDVDNIQAAQRSATAGRRPSIGPLARKQAENKTRGPGADVAPFPAKMCSV
jgi:hypothetical protein